MINQITIFTARRALSFLMISVTAAAVLHASRHHLPVPPLTSPDELVQWLNHQGIALSTVAIVRLLGLALCGYLVLISMLALLAALTRWSWMTTLTGWIVTPALRRLLIGGSLAMVLSTQQPAAAAVASSVAASDEVAITNPTHHFTATDIGPATPVNTKATRVIHTPTANPETTQVTHTPTADPETTQVTHTPTQTEFTATDIGPAAITDTHSNSHPPTTSPQLKFAIGDLDSNPEPTADRSFRLTDIGPTTTTDTTPTANKAHTQRQAATTQTESVLTDNTPTQTEFTLTDIGSTTTTDITPTTPTANKAHTPTQTEFRLTDIGPTNPHTQRQAAVTQTEFVATDLGPAVTGEVKSDSHKSDLHQSSSHDSDSQTVANEIVSAQRMLPDSKQGETNPTAVTEQDKTDLAVVTEQSETNPAAVTEQSETNAAVVSERKTWVVMPGDNLWGIAADTVAERTGSTEPHAVLQYWLHLIEVNSDTLAGNPDLIYPGQIIQLPN